MAGGARRDRLKDIFIRPLATAVHTLSKRSLAPGVTDVVVGLDHSLASSAPLSASLPGMLAAAHLRTSTVIDASNATVSVDVRSVSADNSSIITAISPLTSSAHIPAVPLVVNSSLGQPSSPANIHSTSPIDRKRDIILAGIKGTLQVAATTLKLAPIPNLDQIPTALLRLVVIYEVGVGPYFMVIIKLIRA
jgi:hypothetical protein